MREPHNFDACLQASHAAHVLPLWEELYRASFPNFHSMVLHAGDGDHQRAGVDRLVVLSNSVTYRIDEKIRWKAYPDIALEHLSDVKRGALGWVCKPLWAEFIAYGIAPTGKGYLLPVPQLQAAWRKYGQAWLNQYPVQIAPNNGWDTAFTCVPVDVLFKAIGEFLRPRFRPIRDGVCSAMSSGGQSARDMSREILRRTNDPQALASFLYEEPVEYADVPF